MRTRREKPCTSTCVRSDGGSPRYALSRRMLSAARAPSIAPSHSAVRNISLLASGPGDDRLPRDRRRRPRSDGGRCARWGDRSGSPSTRAPPKLAYIGAARESRAVRSLTIYRASVDRPPGRSPSACRRGFAGLRGTCPASTPPRPVRPPGSSSHAARTQGSSAHAGRRRDPTCCLSIPLAQRSERAENFTPGAFHHRVPACRCLRSSRG